MEAKQTSRIKPLKVLFLVVLGFFCLSYLVSYLTITWPPHWLELRNQREELLQRVEVAGGWAALQRECDDLVAQHRDGVFFWTRSEKTDGLPPVMTALKPMEVWYYSPAALRGMQDATPCSVVHIKVFGGHATGGHSTPYYGLEIISGTNADGYQPQPSSSGAIGNHYDSWREVTNRIYEIY